MPTSKKLKKEEKKRKEEQEQEEYSENESMSDDTDSQDDDEDADDEVDDNEEIMIDFEARSIEESDFESVKLLVQQKLGSFSLNVHETAKIIVQQDSIGNVIFQSLQEDEDETTESMEASNSNSDSTIFGVLSLVDLNSSRCKKYSDDFKSFILKESQKHDKQNNKNLTAQLSQLFKEKKVSFVVNERFINIPPAISVPMFESLLKDLEQIKSNENNFTSDYWLFLSKRFQSDGAESENDSNLIYSNPEEEVFEQFSEFKFEITHGKQTPKGTNGKWSNKDPQLSTVTNCLVVSFNKIKDCIEKIKTLI